MNTLYLLDCTLRDGGYVNDWNFGENQIKKISKKISESNVETIECGFLSQTKEISKDKSIYKTIKEAEGYFKDVLNNNLALMINCGEYNPDDLPKYQDGKISIIRIAFHKHQRNEAQNLCVKLKANGFRVFFQPMYTLGYTDLELLDVIKWANENSPEAFYIVDSFGTMRGNDVLRIFYLIDNNLNSKIKIGFHSHNNLQLSFSNAQELVKLHSKRDIIIDTSVFGMGRGAGNLCTELMTRYINENIENKYDLIPILEIMDEYIMPIYSQHPWGYSAPYYIAAINGCHPNYATYLVNRQTLCIKDINKIIKSVPVDKKHLFDKELINKLYLQYQSHSVDDTLAISQISELCKDRKILILAPGKSVLTYRSEIQKYIEQNDPVIFAINHIPKFYRFDRIFISNLKRFKSLDEAVDKIKEKLICSSNITISDGITVVNYSDYLNDDDVIYDNSGLMLINVLKKAGVTNIALAGYDGFNYADSKNYFDEGLANNINAQRQADTNASIIEYFNNIRKTLNIAFVTPTIYDRG